MFIERQRVASTAIRSVGYEPTSRTLEIEFQTGKVYRYLHVPRYVYRELRSAPVIGQYFNDHIKYGYDYEEMREPSQTR